MKVFKLLTPKERVEFIANTVELKSESTLSRFLNSNQENKNLLHLAFIWIVTPQGHEYWSKINFFIQNHESI